MSYYNNFPTLHAKNLNIGFDVGEISPMNWYYAFFAMEWEWSLIHLSLWSCELYQGTSLGLIITILFGIHLFALLKKNFCPFSTSWVWIAIKEARIPIMFHQLGSIMIEICLVIVPYFSLIAEFLFGGESKVSCYSVMVGATDRLHNRNMFW